MQNIEQLKYIFKNYALKKVYCVLSSGLITNYYIDSKQITMNKNFADILVNSLREHIGDVDAVGGPAVSSIPILGILSGNRIYNTFYISKQNKEHGLQKKIEGCINENTEVVSIIDDVVTSGDSILKSIKILKKIYLHIKIKNIVCLVYREELNAEEKFINSGYKFNYLLKSIDLL